MASTPFDLQNVQNPGSESPPEGMDILGFLKRRKSFIIFLGLIGVGVGYMLFHRQIPEYRSNSWVQVIHRNSDVRMKSMMAEKDLSDSDYVIKSPKTLELAYDNHNLAETTILRGKTRDDAVRIMSGILKTRTLSANVIEVSAQGADPADLRRIVQAASEEYVAAQRENYKDASEELKDLLSKARNEYFEELKTAGESYKAFRAESKLDTDGDNPYRTRAKAAELKVSELELQLTEISAELGQLEAALSRGGSREAVLLLVGKSTHGTAASASSAQAIQDTVNSETKIEEILFPMIREEAMLREQLGEDHPRLRQKRMQIEITREHLQRARGAATKPEEKKEPTPDFLAIYVQSLREQLMILERQKSEFEIMAAKEQTLARELLAEEIEDTNRKNEMQHLSALLNETAMQIKQIQVTVGMGGVSATVLQPATHGVLVYPVIGQFLGLGGFLGAFVGLVLGYLVEMADRSFRKPEEIIREFGVPIVGHIPYMTSDKLNSATSGLPFDKTAVSVHLPRSRPAEAYRAVRTAICFSAIGGTHRVISVTSPAAGDGKSTLALNLALSLAQAGKRTVLVEADLRRPKVHKLTGVSNTVGLAEALQGKAEVADAIQETEVGDFYVLPCGSRPKNPAELLDRPIFDQVLATLRQQFEYVIVDTPPVLAVTDPCGVAARVDGTVICMRLSRHTRDLGRRTIEQLRDVGATIAGVVINGVEERDAYGYGNYRYSDYRYYYKNYNFKYGEYGSRDGREYYADDVPESATHVDQSPPKLLS